MFSPAGGVGGGYGLVQYSHVVIFYKIRANGSVVFSNVTKWVEFVMVRDIVDLR